MKTFNDYLVEYNQNERVRTAKLNQIHPKNGHVSRELKTKNPVESGQKDRYLKHKGHINYRLILDNILGDGPTERTARAKNNKNELVNKARKNVR